MTPFISPQQVEKEIPSRTDVLLCSPLWAKHLIWYQVEVVDGLSGVLPPQHVKTQLDAWHTIQIDDGTFEAKAGHVVKVVRSHCHLSLNNMKGVGSILPPLNEALQQGSPWLSERGIVLCPNLAFKQETWNTVNREG